MGKLYNVEIQNNTTRERYEIVSLGDDVQQVHKKVLYSNINRNETILNIKYQDQVLFDNDVGFYYEY